VTFEAWKYNKEDALWRAMLLGCSTPCDTVKGDAKLEKGVEVLEQSLYETSSGKKRAGLTIDWPKLAKAGAGRCS
jgi:hypothetical protein